MTSIFLQVIDGGRGELDIDFYLAGQTGEILLQDLRRSEGNHRCVCHVDSVAAARE